MGTSTPLQLLESPGPRGRPIEAIFVQADRQHGPEQAKLDHPGFRVPQLGSTALLQVAQLLIEQGFVVARLEFYSPVTGRLEDAEAAELTTQLLPVLAKRGVRAAERKLRADEIIYLSGLEVVAPDRSRATLRRNGLLVARPDSAAPNAIASIWETVGTHP